VLLFGGVDLSGPLSCDVWVYDPVANTWALLPDWTGTVHYGPSMVYDSTRGKAILFGGFTEGMPHVDLSDTWAYDITLGDR
jgi:hypothetical protein